MKNFVSILLILLNSILFNMPLYAQEDAKKKVAVYMTGTTSDATYKKVIGAKLVNAITESGEYAAVERTADFLAALSAENDYQTSGEVRDSQIARLGQKFGVRYVVVAEVNELFEECYIVARLINVETGLVERAFDIHGPVESMNQLVSLSQKVAIGLFKGRAETLISKDPGSHYLCAVRNNKVIFISPTKWDQLNESEKNSFEKKGICMWIRKSSSQEEWTRKWHVKERWVIVPFQDEYGTWDECRNKVLSEPEFEIIYPQIEDLNKALKIFGGDPLDMNSYYWTRTEEMNGWDAYLFDMSWVGGKERTSRKTKHKFRRVYDLNYYTKLWEK